MSYNLKLAFLVTLFLYSSFKIITLVKERNNQISIQMPITQLTEKSEIALKTIKINDIGIDLPITEATIKGNKWEYSKESVSHLAGTPLPGDIGNSVFYGHNWPNLLGNLKKVKLGAQMVITLSNGETRNFIATQKLTVTPDQTHILNQTQDTKVTIYTCAGLLDSKRLVVVFEPY